MKVMVVGATGAVGKRLVPLLRDSGYAVVGTTRSAAKACSIRALGAEPLVLDALDEAAVLRAFWEVAPDARRLQLVDRQARRDRREVRLRVLDLLVGAVEAQERFLHHVLGLVDAPEHPVRDREQQRPELLVCGVRLHRPL